MPGLARNSGWNAARTEPFDFLLHYSNCPVCKYSGATKGSFIQQGCLVSATRAGAGAGPRQGQAHIRGRGARPPPDGWESSRWLAWFWQGSADSHTRCWRSPYPRPRPGPSCSLLVHTHCPHVCSTLCRPRQRRRSPCSSCVQRHLRPEQLLLTSCKDKSRIRLESTITSCKDKSRIRLESTVEKLSE